MRFTAALLLVASATAALNMGKLMGMLNGAAATITVCSGANAHAKNLVVSIDPTSPISGQNMTTVFDYDLDKQVTGGSAVYSANLNGLPWSQTDDLCADQAGSSDPCPLAVGTHHDVSVSQFASFSGTLKTKIQWFDQDGEEVLCVSMTFKQ